MSLNASASVMVLEGNHPQPGLENVLLYKSSTPGQSILGSTNSTHTLVDFSTLSGDLMVAGSNGQSYITGFGGGSGANGGMISDISIELAHGDPFTTLIFALNLPGVGEASACFGCITYSATGSAAGSGKLPGAIGPGTTFFTFVAPPGEELTSVTLSGVAWQRVEDIRQVRITLGADHSRSVAEIATPEPGTFLLVCGGALIALGNIRRRRKTT